MMNSSWSRNVRASSLAIVFGAAAVWGLPIAPAAAFPGESAREMIAKHGPPVLPGTLPVLSKTAFQGGKTPSVLVVWFNTKYRPLSLPIEMEGRVVASFQFDRDATLTRIGQGKSQAVWDDLRSDFENLFTSLSTEQFHQFLTALKHDWTITKVTHRQTPPYDLYEAVSNDRRFKTEFSFRTPGVPSPAASDPYYGGKFPDGNVWIRVQRIGG
jgi:hypothetical protein